MGKGRKKPATEVVDQKVEQILANATNKVVPNELSPEDRERIVAGLIDVVRPTLDQVMEYRPNTKRIVSAAQHTGSGRAIKRSASKKSTPEKAAAKKAAAKRAMPKKPAPKKSVASERAR